MVAQRRSRSPRKRPSRTRGSRARGPDQLHSQIHLQPRPQSHRAAVLLSGADRGVRRHVPVAADAHPHDLADGRSAAAGRHQAGNLPQPADHARHHHGVLRADHGAAERVRQLLSADPDRRAGYGVPGPEHAFVLDHVRRVRGDARGLLRDGRRAAARLDGLCPAERPAHRRARASNWAQTCGSSASRSSASPR